MRLIDADALCEYANNQIDKTVDANDIMRFPHVDAVPVVRCRDCKFSQPWYADKSRCFLWHESGIDVFNDGYCSYGKRKEDVHNDTNTET